MLKYREVKSQILHMKMENGGKLPSQRSLKSNLKVSLGTINKAIQEIKREEKLSLAQPSPKKVRKEYKDIHIGVSITSFKDTFSGLVLSGIHNVVLDKGVRLTLLENEKVFKKEMDALDDLIHIKKIDGLLILPRSVYVLNQDYIQYFDQLRVSHAIPVHFMGFSLSTQKNECTRIQHFESYFKELKKTFSSYQFTKIFYYGPTDTIPDFHRINGLKAAMEEKKVPLSDLTVINAQLPFEIIDGMLKKHKNTLIVTGKPHLTERLCQMLKYDSEFQRLNPWIVGVVEQGYEESIDIPFMAMEKPSFALGKKAANKILKLIQGEDVKYSAPLSYHCHRSEKLEADFKTNRVNRK